MQTFITTYFFTHFFTIVSFFLLTKSEDQLTIHQIDYSLWLLFVHLFALHFISQKSSLHFQLLTNSRNYVSCSFMMHFTIFGKKFRFRRILEHTGLYRDCTKHYSSLPFRSLLIDKTNVSEIICADTKMSRICYVNKSSRKFENCVTKR